MAVPSTCANPSTASSRRAQRSGTDAGGDSDKYLVRSYTEALGNPALDTLTTDAMTTAMGVKTPGTWNRYRNTLLAILHHAEAMGWLDKVPTIPSRKTPPGRTRWLSQDEWARLEAELPARFALATGIRRANLLGLKWSEIDLRRRVMWIHPDEAKASKAIGIPLSGNAIDILKGQIGQHDTHVFTYERTRYKKRSASRWPRLAKRISAR